jgi:hypothetical protein
MTWSEPSAVLRTAIVVDINSDCGKLRVTIHRILDDAGAFTGSKSKIALSEAARLLWEESELL